MLTKRFFLDRLLLYIYYFWFINMKFAVIWVKNAFRCNSVPSEEMKSIPLQYNCLLVDYLHLMFFKRVQRIQGDGLALTPFHKICPSLQKSLDTPALYLSLVLKLYIITLCNKGHTPQFIKKITNFVQIRRESNPFRL